MTTVKQMVPDVRTADLAETVNGLAALSCCEPFGDSTCRFVEELSNSFFSNEARVAPELAAVGFSFRAAEIKKLKADFSARQSAQILYAARGLIFHIPPSNVETVFLYSWIYALLLGNKNLVRLSDDMGPTAALACRLIQQVLADPQHAEIASRNVMLAYGHDAAVTEALSKACDMRVVWGGDQTIRAIRAIPLNPIAKEIVFGDRYSLAAIHIETYNRSDAAAKSRLAEQFFNDAYIFDQRACSSPRLIAWVGDESGIDRAQSDFFERLRTIVTKKKLEPDVAGYLHKWTVSCKLLLSPDAEEFREYGNEITCIRFTKFAEEMREHPGGGLFYNLCLKGLGELAAFVGPREQTLVYFGFSAADLKAAFRGVNRGIDRIVPIGNALKFNPVWDGYDLLEEFSRKVSFQ